MDVIFDVFVVCRVQRMPEVILDGDCCLFSGGSSRLMTLVGVHSRDNTAGRIDVASIYFEV